MAQTFKLTYFNGKGRGECIRLILSYLGLEFEDIRVVYEEFGEFKKKTPLPLEFLPILEVDGKTLHQSISICRYLARKYDLVGKNEWDSLQCDIVVDATQDLITSLWDYRMGTESYKEKEEKKLKTVTIPKYLTYFNNVIKNNNGFTVSSQITWSDIVLAFLIEEVAIDFKSSLENYPDVVGFKEKIYSHPKIAEWLTKRPSNEIF